MVKTHHVLPLAHTHTHQVWTLLQWRHMTIRDAEACSALLKKPIPMRVPWTGKLHSVDLTFANTLLTRKDIKGLAMIVTHDTLRVLALDLKNTSMRPQALRALLEMAKSTLVHRLDLNLQQRHVGLRSFAILQQCMSLKSLNLNFGYDLRDLVRRGVSSVFTVSEGCVEAIASLHGCVALHTLTLQLACNYVKDEHCRILARLKKTQCLQKLTLDLGYNRITDDGVAVFGSLQTCSSLRMLNLNLCGNEFGCDGMQRLLWGLRACKTLQTLALQLSFNDIGDRGIAHVPLLNHCRSLHTLHLGLRRTYMRSTDSLAMLRNCGTLSTLHLNLGYNDIGDKGIQSLGMLSSCTTLHTLRICLRRTRISKIDVLSDLSQCVSLRTLWLDLTHNSIGDQGIEVLGKLWRLTSLHSLSLKLKACAVRDTMPLILFGKCTTLQTLDIDLRSNLLQSHNAYSLAVSLYTSFARPKTLTLNLAANDIDSATVAALRGLQCHRV